MAEKRDEKSAALVIVVVQLNTISMLTLNLSLLL